MCPYLSGDRHPAPRRTALRTTSRGRLLIGNGANSQAQMLAVTIALVIIVSILGFAPVEVTAAHPPSSPTATGPNLIRAPLETSGTSRSSIAAMSGSDSTPFVNSETSISYSGYYYCPVLYESGACGEPSSQYLVQSIWGAWSLPSLMLSENTTEEISIWVGIGGFENGSYSYTGGSMIQAGFLDLLEPGQAPNYTSWWGWAPGLTSNVSLAPDSQISPGDSVAVEVSYVLTDSSGDQYWDFSIFDNSTHSSWSGEQECAHGCPKSQFTSANWIEESPVLPDNDVEIPAFSSWEMNSARYYSPLFGWQPLGSPISGDATSLYLWDAYNSGDIVGVPSSFGYDGSFWMQYLIDGVDARDSPGWGYLPNGTVEPGQTIAGEIKM